MKLHACPMTEEGQRLLGLKENQQVAVIDSQSQDSDGEELPEEEMDSKEAREFGERLCERKVSDWSIAHQQDEVVKTAINFMLANMSVGDISDEVIPETAEKTELKRLMAQGELLELSDS